MKKIYFVLGVFVTSSTLQAQVVIDNTQQVQSVVEDIFLGNGIFVANITFNGQSADVVHDQFASFTDANNGIGITNGLCMSTGVATSMSMESSGMGAPLNPYLNQDVDVLALLTNEFALGDLASLEFDFIATGNICNFQYVFASNEYPEWVETAYNDHFGFFVSGPEVFGPFSNGGVNIALIPGTTESVGINSLNAAEHAEYYVSNEAYTTSVGFDAFTTVLDAHIENLVVGEVYHVKLVIADVSDSALDSGVFLRGDSFQQDCTEAGGGGTMTETCMLSTLNAEVHYTENCGTISLTNLSDMNIETTNCYYEMGDGNTTTACDANTLYTYNAPGTYTLKLVYEVGAFKAKFTVSEILISDVPANIPVISVGDISSDLEVENWDGTSALQWFLDGVAIEGAVSNTYFVTQPGSYTVVANNGCPSESEVFIVLDIAQVQANRDLLVLQNPSKDAIHLTSSKGNGSVFIYNSAGQLVANEKLTAGSIFISPQSAGIYAVKVVALDGKLIDQCKVIVN